MQEEHLQECLAHRKHLLHDIAIVIIKYHLVSILYFVMLL